MKAKGHICPATATGQVRRGLAKVFAIAFGLFLVLSLATHRLWLQPATVAAAAAVVSAATNPRLIRIDSTAARWPNIVIVMVSALCCLWSSRLALPLISAF